MNPALFIVNSIFLGVGLAMDAFSLSVAYGLSVGAGLESGRKGTKEYSKGRNEVALKMCLTFGGFQALMPMFGWLCLHTLAGLFDVVKRAIPFVAFALLVYLGLRMVVEGFRKRKDPEVTSTLENSPLIVQGIATSIDAFSAGAAFVPYNALQALTASVIIAVVTFIICSLGIRLGKRLGMRFADHATILGGVILILIGIEVLVV